MVVGFRRADESGLVCVGYRDVGTRGRVSLRVKNRPGNRAGDVLAGTNAGQKKRNHNRAQTFAGYASHGRPPWGRVHVKAEQFKFSFSAICTMMLKSGEPLAGNLLPQPICILKCNRFGKSPEFALAPNSMFGGIDLPWSNPCAGISSGCSC